MIGESNMERTEMMEYFQASTDTYRFLSQMIFKELNDEAIDELAKAEWPRETGNEHLDLGYAYIRRYFKFSNNDRRTQLAVEYARVFLAAGIYGAKNWAAVPYESVFTSEEHAMMGDSRADLLKVFSHDGFKVDPSLHEPEDHLSFELEYLSHMSAAAAELLEQGRIGELRINIKRQATFINKHLLNWVPALLEKSKEYAKTSFYLGMLYVMIGSLEQSRAVLKEIWGETDPAAERKAA